MAGKISHLCVLGLLLSPMVVQAHGARAVMDAAGTTPTFTALARATCFDDGAGPAAYLFARIRDNSAPVEGLYVSLQLLKGTQAISISDTVSGDAGYSDYVALAGGNGVYTMMLNKTRAGPREVDVEWHCMTADDEHTGTDILVDQFK
jgi:hypothetical protein